MNLPSINLNKFLYLKFLLLECSISKAAKKAGISQPAMSHILKELRHHLKDPLLVKGTKGLVPTQKALSILQKIETGAKIFQSIIDDTTQVNPQTTPYHFKIICTDYIGIVLLPKLMQYLSHHCPHITIEIWPWATREDPLMLDQADVIIGFLPEATLNFHEQLLFTEHYVCMINQAHPRIKHTLTLDTFLNEKHAIVREKDGAIGIVNQALSSHGVSREIVLEIPHFSVFPFIIANTPWVITTTSRNCTIFESFLPIKSVPFPIPLPSMPVKQIWHPRTHNSLPHQWLRELVYTLAQEV